MVTSHIQEKQPDSTLLAIAAIIIAMLSLSFGDALVKLYSADFVIWQIFILRSVIAVAVLMVAWWLWVPRDRKRPGHIGWTSLRSLLMVIMWIFYYLALPNVQLSLAAAAMYVAPLFITLFSAVFLGERIRPVGWIAATIGFVGVLVILRPRAGDINFYAFLPIIAAMFYGFAVILTRSKCRNEHPVTLSIALNAAFLVVGAIGTAIVPFLTDKREGFFLGLWPDMGGAEWVTMLILVAVILITGFFVIIAYQNGRPQIVSTFDFSYVGFAVLWGALMFGDLPDTISFVGILMIVGGGMLSLRN
ncbi:MAG: EamA family transporter [Boseongicola sp.]|nr:MAG: EamA family transporter [Boseongicola sp.]